MPGLILKGVSLKCCDCQSTDWSPRIELVPVPEGIRAKIIQLVCSGCSLVLDIEGGVTQDPQREVAPRSLLILPQGEAHV